MGFLAFVHLQIGIIANSEFRFSQISAILLFSVNAYFQNRKGEYYVKSKMEHMVIWNLPGFSPVFAYSLFYEAGRGWQLGNFGRFRAASLDLLRRTGCKQTQD